MDATAFKLLERKRRFKPQTLEIAKRRILRREPATALAAAYGVNLQRIYTIETQVTAAWGLRRSAAALPFDGCVAQPGKAGGNSLKTGPMATDSRIKVRKESLHNRLAGTTSARRLVRNHPVATKRRNR